MTLSRKIKENALWSLKSHWGRAIGILFFVIGITVVFWMLEYLFSLITQMTTPSEAMLTLNLWGGQLHISSSMAVITATFLVVSFAVLSPLQLGVKKWYCGQISGQTPPILTILDYFYNWKSLFQAILLRLGVWVRKALWAVLFAIPSALLAASFFLVQWPLYGMQALLYVALTVLFVAVTAIMGVLWYFVTLRYYLADYIFVMEDGISVRKAIQKSVTIMKGSKRVLFGLQLSLLPWYLTVIFLVPIIFVSPYFSASMAIFAKVRLEGYAYKMKQSEEFPV